MTSRWFRLATAGALATGLAHCGGTTEDGSSGGSSGSGAATGGSGGSGAATGGSSGSGSGGTAPTGGSAGTGGNPDFFACQVTSDCLIRPASCCGNCGSATRSDVIAINQKYANDYSEGVCQGGGCPACFSPQDPTLLATCSKGSCEVVDLLSHPSTGCQTDADCRVRTTDCCECGGATDPDHLVAISVNGTAAFSALVCDPEVGCPECAPVYPAVDVTCADGHCIIDTPPNP